MNVRILLRVFLLIAAATAGARAEQNPSFERLLNSGFREVSAPSGAAPATPPAAPVQMRAPGDDRGVFLFSDAGGRLAFCSAAGCRTLLDGGASTAVRAKDGLYFTGPAGTGFCAPRRCDLLTPSRLRLTLGAGPAGDAYGVDATGVWRLTPTSCTRALTAALKADLSYLDGVWKTNGDFVGTESDLTFWCSNGACRPVKNGEVLFVEDHCGGNAPLGVSYGFWGQEIFRCTPQACTSASENAEHVDNYATCAFDAKGRLHVPARPRGSVVCGDKCRFAADDAISYPTERRYVPSPYNERRRLGTDGAVYELADASKIPAPATNAPSPLPAHVTRSDAHATAVLSFDAPTPCASWLTSDQADEDENGGAHWEPECRLIP
jgi:hypothetical protein